MGNIGRLDRSVVPPLVAALDSPDPALAADAATVLGMIGDKKPSRILTFAAAFAPQPRSLFVLLLASGDCPADRTAVCYTAAHTGSGLDRRGVELPSPSG